MKKIFTTRTVAAILLALICALSIVGCAKQEEESVQYDLIPMVMVDGVLYLDTGYNGTYVTGDTYDREITSAVQGYEQPTENDQSNFGTGFKYRYGAREGTIEIEMNSLCRIFATEAVRQQSQFPNQKGRRVSLRSGLFSALSEKTLYFPGKVCIIYNTEISLAGEKEATHGQALFQIRRDGLQQNSDRADHQI